jgi:hypothetical protein
MALTPTDLERMVGNFLEQIQDQKRRIEALERHATTGLFSGATLTPPGGVDIGRGNLRVLGGRAALQGIVGLGAAVLLTIDTGEITIAQSLHIVAAESGTSDALDTINGGAAGDLLILFADTGDTITLTENGNIRVYGTTDVLANLDFEIMIFDGTYWRGDYVAVGTIW